MDARRREQLLDFALLEWQHAAEEHDAAHRAATAAMDAYVRGGSVAAVREAEAQAT